MTDPSRNGKVPTPEEFFDHCIVVADICEQSLLDGQAVRDEVIRAIQKLTGLHSVHQNDLKALSERLTSSGKKLHEMYAPESVAAAAKQASDAVKTFEGEVKALLNQTTQEIKTIASAFWFWILSALAAAAIFLAVLLFVVFKYVPTLDEIRTRRAELNQLNLQIERMNERIGAQPRK